MSVVVYLETAAPACLAFVRIVPALVCAQSRPDTLVLAAAFGTPADVKLLLKK